MHLILVEVVSHGYSIIRIAAEVEKRVKYFGTPHYHFLSHTAKRALSLVTDKKPVSTSPLYSSCEYFYRTSCNQLKVVCRKADPVKLRKMVSMHSPGSLSRQRCSPPNLVLYAQHQYRRSSIASHVFHFFSLFVCLCIFN